MGVDYGIGLAVSLAVLAYLVVAMVKPERF